MKIHLHIENLRVTITGEIPSSPDLSQLPEESRKAAVLWANHASSGQIMEAFGLSGAQDAGTTFISKLRKRHGVEFFPYRATQKNGVAAK